MKLIRTEDAVGHMLCHDLTRIVKDQMKGAQFRKGHIVTAEDIPMLLSMGKEHLYIWEVDETKLHENEAAERLAALCQNKNMHCTEVKEGKIELIADIDGLFTIDVEKLDLINSLDDIIIATRHSNTVVHRGDKLCGTRVIPLIIEKTKLENAERLAGKKPIMKLLPFHPYKAGIITTGSEVFHGRIKDTFTPVVVEKLAQFGIEMVEHRLVGDGIDSITEAIAEMRELGVEMIVCTGGMSVDPDDMTPAAIKKSGAAIVTYGAPVLPGAMFLLGYFADGMPIMGLPGCVMYAKATVFDLLLPRIAAGVPINKKDIVSLGNGGLCLGCADGCTYPNCNFAV